MKIFQKFYFKYENSYYRSYEIRDNITLSYFGISKIAQGKYFGSPDNYFTIFKDFSNILFEYKNSSNAWSVTCARYASLHKLWWFLKNKIIIIIIIIITDET